MPKISAFRATHFDPARVGDVSKVVTQPYDKIDEALQKEYYDRHDHNFVRIIRRREEPDDPTGMAKYQGAANALREWLDAGVLVEDPKPGFYAYYQTYSTPLGEKTRKGFVAMVRAEPFDRGLVRPHEVTHSGPKIDRYNLLTHARAHFGQVFLLYGDPEKRVNRILDGAAGRAPDLQARDSLGVLHRVWRIDDPGKVREIERDMERREAIVADGHHRFETAVRYHEEMRQKGAKCAPGNSYENVMATLVNMDDEGLTIYPTHRVVYDAPRFHPGLLLEGAAKLFDVREYPFQGAEEEKSARQEMEEDLRIEGMSRPTFGLAMRDHPHRVLMLRDQRGAAGMVRGDRSPEWKSLDVNILHSVLLENLLGIGEDRLDREECVTFVRWVDEALDLLRDEKYQAAFLVNPCTVEQIRTLVRKGERFPQKTTDFYPKMITGLVFCRLHFME